MQVLTADHPNRRTVGFELGEDCVLVAFRSVAQTGALGERCCGLRGRRAFATATPWHLL